MARRRSNGSTPEYGEMGDRLRGVRMARGLSLRALAERLDVSPSLISQVETGRAKPSVSTLYAICTELGISLDELLFTDAGSIQADRRAADQGLPEPQPAAHQAALEIMLPSDPVQRASERKQIRLASGVIWERLTTASMPQVDFFYVTYDVGGASSSEDDFQRHPGQEWGYILSGRLGVRIGFDDYLLEPGDAIAFDSTTPHRLFNAGNEPVHGIWFVLGRRHPELTPAPANQQPPRHRTSG